jgi:hypothetical protein
LAAHQPRIRATGRAGARRVGCRRRRARPQAEGVAPASRPAAQDEAEGGEQGESPMNDGAYAAQYEGPAMKKPERLLGSPPMKLVSEILS